MSLWCSLLTTIMSLYRCPLRHTLSTELMWSACHPNSSCTKTEAMTVTLATPTGTSGGHQGRNPGAVIVRGGDVRALGTAAISCTPMSSLRASAISMVVSTTAVLASPTGCRAGLIPRRTGAATRRAGAVSSSTAALAMQLGCDVCWLRGLPRHVAYVQGTAL